MIDGWVDEGWVDDGLHVGNIRLLNLEQDNVPTSRKCGKICRLNGDLSERAPWGYLWDRQFLGEEIQATGVIVSSGW